MDENEITVEKKCGCLFNTPIRLIIDRENLEKNYTKNQEIWKSKEPCPNCNETILVKEE